MRVGVLVRNEILKATRRLGIWITWLSFLGILAIILGSLYYASTMQEGGSFTLPTAWGAVLGLVPLAAFFSAVAIILLVASEFSWKTARQNVIDGLSKEEWFVAKLFVAVVSSVVFVVTLVVIGGGLAVVGGGGDGSEPWVRTVHLWQMGGGTLLALGYGSIALFAAFLTRGTGAAMGLFFLYAAILESMVGGVLRQLGARWQEVASALPIALFTRLTNASAYDPEAAAQLAVVAAEGGRDAGIWPVWALWGGALAWIAVFVAGAFWIHRKRDL